MTDHSHTKDKLIKYLVEDPVNQVHEVGLDMKANHIYLMGSEDYILPDNEGVEPGVEFSMANRFIKNMNVLMRANDDPILIHMKTCGGDWSEGMAIYDTIKACPNEVVILNYTHARSMSSIILQAADKRVMMPHSTFMFHDGTFAIEGTVKQAFTEIAELQKSSDIMMNIYVEVMKRDGAKFSKRSKKFIKEWLRDQMDKKEEVYFDAKQTVEYGFADQIFGENGYYDWEALLK